MLVMVAFMVVAGLFVGLVVAANSKRSVTNIGANPIPNSVVVVDPASEILAEDLQVGAAPGPIAVGDGSAWIGNIEDHTLTRIDLQSGKTLKTLGLASAPTSLGTSTGLVWIGNGFAGTLSRVLTAYDQLSAPFFPGPAETGILTFAAMPNDLWVGLPDQTLLRLDPQSLRPRSTFQLPGRPRAFAVTADAAWFIDFRDAAVTRFDFASGGPTANVILDGTAIAITSGFGQSGSRHRAQTSCFESIQSPDVPSRPSHLVSHPLRWSPMAAPFGWWADRRGRLRRSTQTDSPS